jgi:hypothetical protein
MGLVKAGDKCPYCKEGIIEAYIKTKFPGDPGKDALMCPECDSQY